jgi:predicted small lipoprotein YifL
MKKLVALLTAATLALTLAACGDSGKEAKAKAEAAAKEAADKTAAAAKGIPSAGQTSSTGPSLSSTMLSSHWPAWVAFSPTTSPWKLAPEKPIWS